MPVHHEKTETPRRKIEGSSSREPSIHRTKQREVSVERRPIISQEKPTTHRQVKTDARKEKIIDKGSTIKTSNRTPKNTTKDFKPTGATSTSRNTSKAKEELLKVRSRLVEKNDGKRTTEAVKPPIKKTASKTSSKVEEKSRIKPAISKSSATVTSKISAPVKPKEAKNSKASESQFKAHIRTKTRTLSPSEVKILPKSLKNNIDDNKTIPPRSAQTSSEKGYKNETASTFDTTEKNHDFEENEKGTNSYDNTDDEEVDGSKSNSEPDADYDDDFEDYESDFEEDSNSDKSSEEVKADEGSKENVIPAGSAEIASRKRIVVTSAEERERKLDSGSYHISSGPHKKEIEQIMVAMKSENHRPRKHSTTKEDIDEGYLEGAIKTNLKKTNSINSIIDFSKAGKKAKEIENYEKVKKRGEELSKMITLDSITYTLMDIPAVPYDAFMAAFGKSNSSQIHTQTNEDDCEEEVQTEEIETTEKWTQAPIRFSPQVAADGKHIYSFTKEEKLGVGGSTISTENEEVVTVSQQRLKKSFTFASQKILVWLEAREQSLISMDAKKTSELTCCDGMTTTNEASEKIAVKLLVTNASNIFLTVQIMRYSESLIKVWNSLLPSTPIATLMCHQEINCGCFSPGRSELVIAGANDGSVNIWDLRDSKVFQNSQSSDQLGNSPTFSTAEILKQDGHNCAVVSVLIIQKEEDQDEEFQPMQVCTLDERGQVIIWSLIQQSTAGKTVPNSDLGLAPWGRIRLIRSSHFVCSHTLPKDTILETETFHAMVAKGSTGNQLLIAASSGNILHCTIDGKPLKPKLFMPSKNSKPSAVMKMALYQADERYFLAGCSDGTIRLHSNNQNRPLINLHWNLGDSTPASSVKSLEWLPSKPCMFFVLDATSRIHVWNLAVSDIYPQIVLPASNNPFSFGAVLHSKKLLQRGSLVFGRANGLVEIHNAKVKSNLNERKNEWKKEMKMFQRYVKIL